MAATPQQQPQQQQQQHGPQQHGQHYSLKWNNHQKHILTAFDDLLQRQSMVDCTLVSDDTSVRAHKVVLSACR